MKLQIICVGKIREKWLSEGVKEYQKRLSRYCETVIIEVPDTPDLIPERQALDKEASAIQSRIRSSSLVWIMDLAGDKMDSATFSDALMRGFEKGGAELSFVIGGSKGLAESIRKRANRRICFSDMTFTHTMSRLILLEQCFRAFKISRGETYHK